MLIDAGLILGDYATVLIEEGANLTMTGTQGLINIDGTLTGLTNNGYFLSEPGAASNFRTQIAVPFTSAGNQSSS